MNVCMHVTDVMDLFWLAVIDHHLLLFTAATATATGVTAATTSVGRRGFDAVMVRWSRGGRG